MDTDAKRDEEIKAKEAGAMMVDSMEYAAPFSIMGLWLIVVASIVVWAIRSRRGGK
jgi:hypothetical protein